MKSKDFPVVAVERTCGRNGCTTRVIQHGSGKKRRFCSDACRQAAYRERKGKKGPKEKARMRDRVYKVLGDVFGYLMRMCYSKLDGPPPG